MKDISGETGAPVIGDGEGRILFDGSFRISFKPIKTLSGPTIRLSVDYDQASAQPMVGGRYLLVVSSNGTKAVVLWKGPVQSGLCLSDDDVKRYGLSRMARRVPCRL